MKKLLLSLLVLLPAVFSASAQSTRVRGRVTDEDTGAPIPFVSIYFDGTTIGISSDLEGEFYLETRSRDAKVLSASLIGYHTQSVTVHQGSFTEVNFKLKQDISQLSAAMVKPDNRYIKSILKKIDAARSVHNPDMQEDWKTDLYTKIELDVTNLEDLVSLGFIDKHIGFVLDYADTSAVTGKSYIPFMISESKSRLYHSRDPELRREMMSASRISGFNDENTISQFTGSYLLKTNFYESTIGVFNLDIPNPIANGSQVFYNYFLVDSLQVDGRKTYVLRFHPKKLVTSPTLDGQMLIDAEDFGIKSVSASLSDESNVNWIRHINVDIENRRLPDGKWFNSEERMFLDGSITLNDNSKMVSFLANRTMVYGVPVYEAVTEPEVLGANDVVSVDNLTAGDDAFWEEVRPYELSEREKGIYKMVDEIQDMTAYKWIYGIGRAFASSYIEIKPLKFEFGQWARTFVTNDTEGFRVRLGGRTLKEFSKKVRLGGYLAYGFKDKDLKWEGSFEWMLGDRDKTRKLTLTAKRDFEQLSSGHGVFTAPNIFSSMVAREISGMQSMIRTFTAHYDHEFSPNVNASIEARVSRLWGNETVPLYTQDLQEVESFGTNEIHAVLRLSYDQRVTRNYFKKTYVFTKYPVVNLHFMQGISGITENDWGYTRAEAIVDWSTPSNAFGFGKLNLHGGFILGSVPYPCLKLHEGNQTFFLDRTAFSCMNYYEFLSDRWLTGYYEHNFNGFFLGKIPLVKELDLREVATVRAAWGTISDANKGENAPYILPYGASTLEIPYVEAGVGISNIFRFFRVDCFWRLTHLHEDGSNNFTVNVGVDVEF